MKSIPQYRKIHLLDFAAVLVTLAVVSVTTWHAFAAEDTSQKDTDASQFATAVEANDQYTRFSMELYDTIKEHYWQDLNADQFATLYRESARRVLSQVEGGSVSGIATTTRTGIAQMMHDTYQTVPGNMRRDVAVTHAQMVLQNLQPAGRSRLLTKVEEQKFRDDVANKDPKQKLYDVAGVNKSSSTEEIQREIAQKQEKLAQKDTKQAKEQLQQLDEAKEVLTDEQNKERYDTQKVLPTVEGKRMNESVYYIKLEKISPTTIQDFVKIANEAPDDEDLNSLILDLRGNIGGSVGLLKYLLGPFIGPNQIAYTFFHQDEKNDHKTKAGWLDSLVKYKKVVVLIDGQSQSSAETMAAALKTYNVGVLVGETTRGWGTIENTYELETNISENKSYMALLVNNLTLRTDGQPIEDNGVRPHVKITSDNWRKQLRDYHSFPPLIDAVEKLYADDENAAP